jgi:hypothetical protein
MEDKARKIGLEIIESKTKYRKQKEDTRLESRREIIYGCE